MLTVSIQKSSINLVSFLLLVYAVIVSVMRVFNPSFWGLPLFSLFFIILSFYVSFILLVKSKSNGKYFSNWWLFVFVVFVSFIFSLLNGWDIFASIYNAFLYGMPFLLVILPSYYKIELDLCLACVNVMVIIGTVISLCTYFGIVDSGLSNSVANLNILVLDNSIGLLGIIVNLYIIFDFSKSRNKINYFYLVLSYLIVIMGQSRARIILSIFITFVFIAFVLFKNKKERSKLIKIVIAFTIVVVVLIGCNYDFVMEYMVFSIGKFESNFEDASTEYRLNEIYSHFEILHENPIIGIGCGALNNKYYTSVDDYFYGHCMLTSFFALNGFFIGIIMLLCLLVIFVKSLKVYRNNNNMLSLMGVVLICTVFFLSSSSAGFAKYSTHFMMLILGCCFRELWEEHKCF